MFTDQLAAAAPQQSAALLSHTDGFRRLHNVPRSLIHFNYLIHYYATCTAPPCSYMLHKHQRTMRKMLQSPRRHELPDTFTATPEPAGDLSTRTFCVNYTSKTSTCRWCRDCMPVLEGGAAIGGGGACPRAEYEPQSRWKIKPGSVFSVQR